MDKFSLGSAIFGGLITAVFSFIIGYIFFWQDKIEKRKRVAYLYYVRISTIIALKQFLKKELGEQLDKLRQMPKIDKLYMDHKVSVDLVEKLKDESGIEGIIGKTGHDKQTILDLLKKLKDSADENFGFKINDEMLSTLPQNVILHYNYFIGYLKELERTLSVWISSIESNDFSSFKPEDLICQVRNIIKLSESADIISSILIKKSGIKSKDSQDIVNQQINILSEGTQEMRLTKKIFEFMKDLKNNKQNQTEQPSTTISDNGEKTIINK